MQRRAVALLAMAAGVLTAVAPAHAGTLLDRTQATQIARAHVAAAKSGVSLPVDCVGPAGDPAPGTQAWTDRDRANQLCSTERLVDEYASPAFGATFWSQTPGIFISQNVEMLMSPTQPRATLAQVVPGGTTTDPFRTLSRWTAAGRGRVTKISFPAADGATLRGHVLRPPASVPGPYPAVVITTGSIQGYKEMYYWAAEGLAEAGYMVLTYDVQGQGQSDTLPSSCTPSSCPGVPFQQGYNFYQGTRDALNWLFSATDNPHRGELDAERVGLAGHSLGAGAVSLVGQCDPRVKAIVGWDNLAAVSGKCADAAATGLPDGAPESPTLDVPALGIFSEYFFNPSSTDTPPDPQAKSGAFRQLSAVGTDVMQIGLRASTHLEYTYVPYILPASRLGERVAWHYTLAWFDRYLRDDPSALARLTATAFDPSGDAAAIGAGRYDVAKAIARPLDPAAGNVPYALQGLPVADRLSFYYRSQYSLSQPGTTAKVECSDMRAGC